MLNSTPFTMGLSTYILKKKNHKYAITPHRDVCICNVVVNFFIIRFVPFRVFVATFFRLMKIFIMMMRRKRNGRRSHGFPCSWITHGRKNIMKNTWHKTNQVGAI